VPDSKTPKRQRDVLAEQILDALCLNPEITQKDLAKKLFVSYRSLQREMDELKADGKIERIGDRSK
jgi:predicted transcriptional regulator